MRSISRLARSPAARFAVRFSLLCIASLTVISLIPSDAFYPLNRLTAHSTGELLKVFDRAAAGTGAHLTYRGFSAAIIPECTILFCAVILFSFIVAYPSSPANKAAGALLGGFLLFGVNTARIAAVMMIGAAFRSWFDVAHVCLGQVVMIFALLAFCRLWLTTSALTLRQRMFGLAFGLSIISVFQLLIRLGNAVISIAGMHWTIPLANAVYNINVFGLPLVLLPICLYLFGTHTPERVAPSRRARRPPKSKRD